MNHFVANCSDFSAISICFQDPEISFLFAELLESRGVNTRLIFDADHIPDNGKIVTEPLYYSRLTKVMKKNNCLLVGNPENFITQDAIRLTRPLTADKIEGAIAQFLE